MLKRFCLQAFLLASFAASGVAFAPGASAAELATPTVTAPVQPPATTQETPRPRPKPGHPEDGDDR